MGGDGGVIANQRKYLRTCKDSIEKEEGKQTKDSLQQRSKVCAFSGDILSDHIVCCELGNLFNKEKVINGLISKDVQRVFPHIRGLKDLKDVKYSREIDTKEIICPVTRMEFNGIHRFVLIWPTGYLLSDKAIKEMGKPSLQDEYGPFGEGDIIVVLPSEEEIGFLKTKIEESRNKKLAEKSDKKEKKRPHTEEITFADQKTKKKLSKAESVVATAVTAVDSNANRSSVFKHLFHDDKEASKSNRDLFMNVSGIRYTLN